MNNDPNANYPINLGKLISNLHSLEVSIRTFLFIKNIGLDSSKEHAQSLRNLKVGQSVTENHFTDYDTLKTLIKIYNKEVSKFDSELIVDETIVGLRDALAHGRVFSFEPFSPMILLKFSKPNSGNTIVEFMAIMTTEWFDKQIKRVHNEFGKVLKASNQISTGNN
ncbi:hypothetical protein ACFLV4_06325 [Chloroflexota bacterium]